jgi:5-oxoprolinase (ATP-hydrolysing) subunit C
VIEILSNGALNSVQDLGRAAHLRIGVSGGGAMDAVALATANCMVGNEPSAAGIEVSIFPFRVRFEEPAWFACAGAQSTLTLPHRTLPSWWAAQAGAGDVLTVAPPELGARVYLALQGGIDVPEVLGSRSTDLKSGFGGFKGRGLRKGDRLALGESGVGEVEMRAFGVAPESRRRLNEQLAAGTVTIRVVAAAEYEHFTDEATAAFERGEYRVTPDSNRQGYRLEGAPLKTKKPLQLLSHGIVPGTVQVPPAGQPILQLAEANTCGGYPKIATIIEPDLWRVAQLRPGQKIRFERVDYDTAVAAVAARASEDARIRQALALRWPSPAATAA